MNNCCKPLIEPCHSGECDGFNEVVQLLPQGQIWNPDRGGVYGAYIQALGHIKTELNKIICQEWNELNPCTSKRLFGYWAEFYKLPPCVEQTGDKLCEWIDLLYNQDCPIGSLGFLRKAIEFVLPNDEVSLDIKTDQVPLNWRTDDFDCADNNHIVITAPARVFKYYKFKGDYPHNSPDGKHNCRRYFIPEIECLRKCIFPLGLSVGYKTTESGRFDINNIDVISEAKRPQSSFVCNTKTGDLSDHICGLEKENITRKQSYEPDIDTTVEEAGGNIKGKLRITQWWQGYSDIDIGLTEPNGEYIYYSHKNSRSGGKLDVDKTGGSYEGVDSPNYTQVENIVYSQESNPLAGKYTLNFRMYLVKNRSQRLATEDIPSFKIVFTPEKEGKQSYAVFKWVGGQVETNSSLNRNICDFYYENEQIRITKIYPNVRLVKIKGNKIIKDF